MASSSSLEDSSFLPKQVGLLRFYQIHQNSLQTPTDVTSLQSFLGLLNQVAQWNPDLAQHTTSMRSMLKKGADWAWDEKKQEEFDKAKRNLTESQKLRPFDPDLPVKLLTDASRLHGLGFVLLQIGKAGEFTLVQCGSCSLTDAQTHYSTIELECLGIVWSSLKCDFYLRGLQSFEVWTDHRPLEGIWKNNFVT